VYLGVHRIIFFSRYPRWKCLQSHRKADNIYCM